MVEPKYAVKGTEEVIGVMYDVGDNREIFVMFTNAIKPDDAWTVRDMDGNDVGEFEVLDMLNKILPKSVNND